MLNHPLKLGKSQDFRSYYTKPKINTSGLFNKRTTFNAKAAVSHLNSDQINKRWTASVFSSELKNLYCDIVDCYQYELEKHMEQKPSRKEDSHFYSQCMNYKDALEHLMFISGGMEESYQQIFSETIRIIDNQYSQHVTSRSLRDLESLKTALCDTASPPNTIVVHRRNSQGIYQAEEVADYHDDPNIILHSKYSSRHRNGDRLDYTSATDNLLQEASGGSWSQEKLAVECRALIIDITKACNDEMLWYEDIMEEKSDRTTVRWAITSLHRLVNEMRGRKIAVDHHLKDSVDRLYRADNKKNSEKMKRCVECATSRKCLKAELKAHIENELKKDIALLTNKRKLTYEEKSYFKELSS